MALKKKIIDKTALISVIGLGYVGLPLAIAFASAGYKVIGLEADPCKVNKLLMGISYIKDVPDTAIIQEVRKGNLTVAEKKEELNQADVIIICVPTPLKDNKIPDTKYIEQVIEDIKKYGKKASLIILESTTYPGTTEELIQSELEQEGWVLGVDFNLCFSPERVDPGNIEYHIGNTPKVIGGASKKCIQLGEVLYSTVTKQVFTVSSLRVAEMVKLLENTFRSVNIALINELALLGELMGINIWEVIEAASTKPFGFLPFYPGPGVGGHCIPIDPIYLEWKANKFNFSSEFIKLATKINEKMPEYIVDTIEKILKKQGKVLKGAKVLIIGVGYKKDTEDVRESPALMIIDALANLDVRVDYYDPLVPRLTMKKSGFSLTSINFTKENLEQYDCSIILADHSNIDFQLLLENCKTIYDTRNALGNINENIYLLGRDY